MKRRQFLVKIIIWIGLTIAMCLAHSLPLWTYSAPSPASVNVSNGGTATTTYIVTSQTSKPKSLVITNFFKSYPATPGVTSSPCNLVGKGSTCTLTITIDGSQVPANGIHSGPYLCQSDGNGGPNLNQCYQPSAANVLNISKNTTQQTVLSVSVSQLALSVTGLTEYGVSGTPSSGLARIITITNNGSNTAVNLDVTSPTWPVGTTNTTTCSNSLAVGSSCTMTITPGAIATSDGTNPCSTGTAPVPGVIQISADNANTVSINVVVLGYGCVYQGGYVYALDDTTSNTGSVGGKVVTTSDQVAAYPNGVVWSSNGQTGNGLAGTDPNDVSNDTIPGIDDMSTSSTGLPSYDTFSTFFASTYTNLNPFTSASFEMCNGISDGSCNTKNILVFYDQFITNNTLGNGGSAPFTASPGPTDHTYYAAGLCKQTIANYSDWYLPAICEIGYDARGGDCGTSGVPTLQNIQSSLIDISGFSAPAGYYWSSTEFWVSPQRYALYQFFASGGGNAQGNEGKSRQYGVRCSRDLTF